MNILHLLSWCPNPEDPTLGNFCIRQINALPKECNSIILSVYEDKNLKKGYKIQDDDCGHYKMVRIHFAPWKNNISRKIHIIRLYDTGLDYIKKHYFTPELIHVHVAYPLGIIALRWKIKYGIEYVLTEHWTIYQPQNADSLKGFMKKAIVKVGRNAKSIMPVSRDLQRCMEHIGINNNYRVVYNLVDTNMFMPSQPTLIGKKRILHVSTLRDEAKNFSGILRTIARLRKERDDFELHVIHDYDAPDFKEYVAKNNLGDCVFFHGKKTSREVAEFLSTTDFFILFSNFENLPCVIIESFASGVPVVCTNVGGISEIMSDERGIMISHGNEDALLEAMRFMLDNPDKYDRKTIRRYASSTFNNETIGRQIFEQYSEAIKR